MKDPYQVLGVARTAGQDEIRNVYRKLAKSSHPDLNPGNKSAEAKFKEIASAYDLIGSAEARAQFDRGESPEQVAEEMARQQRGYAEQGRSGGARQGPFYHQTQEDGGRYSFHFGGENGGAEDVFENLFRSAGRGRSGARGADEPGEDQLYRMEVDFRDSILGGEREITLPSGKHLNVKIPPGIEEGTKLRFKGQGGPAHGKGPAGDAYVEVSVRPRPGFRRVGNDVETEVPVSFIEALIGGEVQVPTLEGAVKLTVPPGVTTGSRLRIRGKGVAPASGSPGDQIAVLKVVMPEKPDPTLQETVRGWAGKYSYDPRKK